MPRRSSSLTLLGFLLLSAPALAGDVYDLVTERQGESQPTKSKIFVDGRKYREVPETDPESARPYQALISRDGGEHVTALNLENHTFYEIKPDDPSYPSNPLLHLLPLPFFHRSVSNVSLETAEAPEPETVSGVATRRHQIKLSYDIAVEMTPPPGAPKLAKTSPPETVHGKVKVDAVYWMAESSVPILPKPLRPSLRTGFPEIDPRLSAALSALQGIPMKQQVSISTEGDHYTTPQISAHTRLLQNHKVQPMKASMFEVPTGFKMKEPEFSGPGLGPVP
jgi:hypothetical protein